MTTEIETDYLVVGAGAAGMAFADELTANSEFDVVMVDRRHSPGGHWNDGYHFLRLHQPSAFYGVNSRKLGADSIDTSGPNAGFYERATAAEICDYYRRVLEEHLVPTGRVRFYGMCDYVGDWTEHVFRSRLSGKTTSVRVRRKVVDAKYLESSVPATHRHSIEVHPAVRLVSAGGLATIADSATGYTVLGAGKTAMDACNWLLENGVDPDRIRWIKPRDSWVLDRSSFQPLDLLGKTIDLFSLGVEALARAGRIEDLFLRVEACGLLARLDPTVEPAMFKGAILSEPEREALRQIENVVRLGRVRRLDTGRIVLENGEIASDPGQVHVDCTADGLPVVPTRPMFEPRRITIQSLVGGQTSSAAAQVAFVESTLEDDSDKNRLCPPLANPNEALDFIRSMIAIIDEFATQMTEPSLMTWSQASRLSLTRAMGDHMQEPLMQSAVARWVANSESAVENARQLLAGAQSHTHVGSLL